jgi:hypothetical protein
VNKTLDSFESALLLELRQHVAEHPAPEPVRARRPRRRLRLAAVGATGVAASVVAVFGLGSAGGSPAYAIDQNSAGDVIVTVHRLDDAAGLERALLAKGIDADVSYDPSPSDGTFSVDDAGPGADAPLPELGSQSGTDEGPSSSQQGGGGAIPQTTPVPGGKDDPCGFGDPLEPPATLAQEGDDWVLTIPAGSPLLEDDRHLDIGTSVDGTLMVTYAGDQPGSSCGLASMGAPS